DGGAGSRGVDLPEAELGGLPDQVDDVGAAAARHRDLDLVAVALDLGLGDAQAVDALTNDVDRLVDRPAVDLLPRLRRARREDDARAALQVQAEPGRERRS